jgi:hypothetical protein
VSGCVCVCVCVFDHHMTPGCTRSPTSAYTQQIRKLIAAIKTISPDGKTTYGALFRHTEATMEVRGFK